MLTVEAHSGQQLYTYSLGAVDNAVLTVKAEYDAGHLPGEKCVAV